MKLIIFILSVLIVAYVVYQLVSYIEYKQLEHDVHISITRVMDSLNAMKISFAQVGLPYKELMSIYSIYDNIDNVAEAFNSRYNTVKDSRQWQPYSTKYSDNAYIIHNLIVDYNTDACRFCKHLDSWKLIPAKFRPEYCLFFETQPRFEY